MFRDLKFVLTFVRDFITQNNLVGLYNQLSTYYQQAQTTATPELEQNISETQSQIFQLHQNLNWLLWSAPKLSILKKTGAYDLLGHEALKRTENIFEKRTSGSIISDLNSLSANTNDLLSKTQRLIKDLNLENTLEDEEEDKMFVELSLEQSSAIKNFWEMREQANELYFVVLAFSRLTGESFRSTKIFSINTASPEIGVALITALKVGKGLLDAAKLAVDLKKFKDEFLNKKKSAENLELEGDTFKLVIDNLEKTYESGRKEKIEKLTLEIVKKHQSSKNENSEELKVLVSKALEKLSDLIGDGGRILDPSEIKPNEFPPVDSLGNKYSELKKLDDKVMPLLEEELKVRLSQKDKKMEKDLGENVVKAKASKQVSRGKPESN